MGGASIPSKLPAVITGCDYYQRETSPMTMDGPFKELIEASRNKIQLIIKKLIPTELNLEDNAAVQNKIKELAKAFKETPSDELRQQLHLLEDLNKINLLSRINIPQDTPPALEYCTLAGAAGGVTEKVSLITVEQLTKQLGHLAAANIDDIKTLADYSAQRNDKEKGFKLSTQAILKLPKHGDMLEVQREAMALNMSRILGIQTTRSTMVSHAGKPALFVPFENIRLLNEVATGKAMQARLFSSAQYSHYSTINPVGAGLQTDSFVSDFGHSFGLFYLCNDTDAIGGNNQNKAIKGNNLFIFDQVFMPTDKLKIDSRLSMQPIDFLMMHTRHGQGRNRTLIEDSSIESKFQSLMTLKQQSEKLIDYCATVVAGHEEKLAVLKREYSEATTWQARKNLTEQIALVGMLMNDARAVAFKVNERISKIDEILPKYGDHSPEGMEVVKKAIILEKLFNKSILFSDDGRPFRHPWTHRNKNRILSIDPETDHPDLLRIKFEGEIPADVVRMLKRHGVTSLTQFSRTELLISKEELKKLDEMVLFPEHQEGPIAGRKYIDPDDLKVIKKGYGEGHHDKTLDAIDRYRSMMPGYQSPAIKLEYMRTIEKELNGYTYGDRDMFIVPPTDRGFGKHVLKKFHFDMQQRLQEMMAKPPAHINEAFQAALKLDRMSEFNAVVREAVMRNKVDDPAFVKFMDDCIERAGTATDHFSAKEQSLQIRDLAEGAIAALKLGDVADARRSSEIMDSYKDALREAKKLDEDEVAADPMTPG